eukprot:COSAG06_NODE_63556_length_262_cov_0.619632_1_plen_44_part_10
MLFQCVWMIVAACSRDMEAAEMVWRMSMLDARVESLRDGLLLPP